MSLQTNLLERTSQPLHAVPEETSSSTVFLIMNQGQVNRKILSALLCFESSQVHLRDLDQAEQFLNQPQNAAPILVIFWDDRNTSDLQRVTEKIYYQNPDLVVIVFFEGDDIEVFRDSLGIYYINSAPSVEEIFGILSQLTATDYRLINLKESNDLVAGDSNQGSYPKGWWLLPFSGLGALIWGALIYTFFT